MMYSFSNDPSRQDFSGSFPQYQLDRELRIVLEQQAEVIELYTLNRLPQGSGSQIVLDSLRALKMHPNYVVEEHEHSALLLPPNENSQGAIYQLVVGYEALTWHRHPSCASRMIQLTTGSGGAMARFSTTTDRELDQDKGALLMNVIEVVLPPDAEIILRFNGYIYHQFAPLELSHPAFCGISFHPNEKAEIAEVHDDWHKDLRPPQLPGRGSIPLLSKFVVLDN